MVEIVALVDEGLGNSSYVVGLGDGRALVVDPARDPRGYLAEADRRGLDVAFALETHLHADFVSGGRELAALGASLLAPAAGGHGFPVRGLRDGEEVDLGGLTLRALATPGHTPEHLAYLLLDGRSPLALFSGGSLLVDAVARTDLVHPDRTEELARSLWRAIHERILTLPDDLPVYPTHGAGSFCASPAGTDRSTTVGRERRANPLLGAPSEDAFVKQLTDGLGPYPPYFLHLRERNRRGFPVDGPAGPALASLEPAEVARLQVAGAWVVDARTVEAFAAGHLPGSVSIALRPQFATWLGWLVPLDAPVVLVLDAGRDGREALRRARGIGFDTVLGQLAGGTAAWLAGGGRLESTAVAASGDAGGVVVDVRQRHEYATGHVPGAVHADLGDLAAADLPAGPIAVMCGHGERAMTAASLLERAGRRDVTAVTGGPHDWARRHGPLEAGGE